MKITEVRTIALSGATDDHGWPGGTDPNVQYNTLVEVVSDEGIVGLGSCYTTRPLVEAALLLLKPLLIGRSALEPEPTSERMRQSMFWLGRGGSVEHAISGLDIALWDLWAKRSARAFRNCSAATTAIESSPTPRSCSTIRQSWSKSYTSKSRAAFAHQDGLAAVRPCEPQARRAARQDGA